MTKFPIGDPSYDFNETTIAVLPHVLIALLMREGGQIFVHKSEIDAGERYHLDVETDEDKSGFYFTATEREAEKP